MVIRVRFKADPWRHLRGSVGRWLGPHMLLAMAIAVGAAAALGAPSGFAAAPDCAVSDALLDQGKLLEAIQAYNAAVAANQQAPCADTGRKAAVSLLAAESLKATQLDVDIVPLIVDAVKARPQTPVPPDLLIGRSGPQAVEALYLAGFYDAANDALKKLITDNPAVIPPADLVPAARAGHGFEVARRLRAAGFRDAAIQVLQQTITAYPQVRVPTDLGDLQPHVSWWQGPLTQTGLDIVAAVLTVAVIGVLLWQMAIGIRRWRRGGSMAVLDFDALSSDEGLGEEFAALVRADIRRLASEAGDGRIDLVTKWSDPITIPSDIASAAPPVGLVAGLAQLLVAIAPSKDRSLAGFVHTASPDGPGASLSLEHRKGGVIDSCSLWVADLPHPPRAAPTAVTAAGKGHTSLAPYRLVFPTAVWALSRVPQNFSLLGTESWKSYLWFESGEQEQSLAHFSKARDDYLMALRMDPESQPVEFNLSVVLHRLAYGAGRP